jgi:RNA polymerase sigma-70 factor (ECF subfamily)
MYRFVHEPRAHPLRDVAQSAGRGDDAALAEFVRRSNRLVWRACAALVDPASADDLTQDTYLRAIPSLPSYRGESDPSRWLLTIARRVCAEEIRRRQTERALVARISTLPTLGNVDPGPALDLADALARLSDDRREAFMLTAIAGLSYADAANACGCPIGTIRSRVARARADLIAAMWCDEPARAPA